MDDYVHCFMAYLTSLPNLMLSSPALSQAVSHTLAALTCPAPETTLICLDTLSLLAQRLSHAQFRPVLQPIFAQFGKAILAIALGGVVQGHPEDALEPTQVILGATVQCAPPAEVELWAREAIASLPGHVVPAAEKEIFLRELHE